MTKKWAVASAMVLTGFSSLLYESIFLLVSVIIIGATAKANACILSLFLLGLALGALTGGYLVKRRQDFRRLLTLSVFMTVIMALLSPVTLSAFSPLFSGATFLPHLLIIVFLIPFFSGMSVPLAVRYLDCDQTEHNTGFIYFANTLGSVLGAALGGLYIIPEYGFFGTIVLSMFLGVIAYLIVLGGTQNSIGKVLLLIITPVLIFVFLIGDGVCFVGQDLSLQKHLYLKRISDEQGTSQEQIGKVIFSKVSTYQHILIVDSVKYGRQLFLNGRIQVSESDSEKYHEFLVMPAVVAHPNPERILVIGEGDGGALPVLLNNTAALIDHVELDPDVIKTSLKYLQKIHKETLNSRRVKRSIMDGRSFLQGTREKYDIVVLAFPDPLEIELSSLFSVEFYELVSDVLTEDGIMVAQTGDVDDVVGDRRYLKAQACILQTVRSIFGQAWIYRTSIPSFLGNNSFIITGKAGDSRTVRNTGLIEEKWQAGTIFNDSLEIQKRLEEEPVPVNRDYKPVLSLFM